MFVATRTGILSQNTTINVFCAKIQPDHKLGVAPTENKKKEPKGRQFVTKRNVKFQHTQSLRKHTLPTFILVICFLSVARFHTSLIFFPEIQMEIQSDYQSLLFMNVVKRNVPWLCFLLPAHHVVSRITTDSKHNATSSKEIKRKLTLAVICHNQL